MDNSLITQTQERISIGIPEACKMTGLGRNSLINLIEAGELLSVKVCGRRLVLLASLQEMMKWKAAETYEATRRETRNAIAARRDRPMKQSGPEAV